VPTDDPVTLSIESARHLGVTCAEPGCNQKATTIATGRGSVAMPLDFYCDTHAEVAAEQECPEYTVHCPNCGCRFGVN
jgi:hypothetical protein